MIKTVNFLSRSCSSIIIYQDHCTTRCFTMDALDSLTAEEGPVAVLLCIDLDVLCDLLNTLTAFQILPRM